MRGLIKPTRADVRTRGGAAGFTLVEMMVAIVAGMIKAHGASVRAESAPGEGTRLTIELPASSTRQAA